MYKSCMYCLLGMFGPETIWSTYLVDIVLLADLIKDCVHVIQHGNYFHGAYQRTNVRESHYITEQNRHIMEHLKQQPQVHI